MGSELQKFTWYNCPYIVTCLYLGNNRSKKEKWLWSHKYETYPIQNMITIISTDIQIPILSSLLFLCCQIKPSYSYSLQFLLSNVRSMRAAGPVCLTLHMQRPPQCLVQVRHSIHTCVMRGEKKRSQWSGDWDEREEWGTTEQIKVK